MSITSSTQKRSLLSESRYFMLNHEVSFGLYGALIVLTCAYFIPSLIMYPIMISLLISVLTIHPSAIGIIPNALDSKFFSTVFRGLLFGFCYGFLNGDYQIGLLHAFGLLIPLLSGIVYWFGYFAEFMHRRGFSDWIIMICTPILATIYVFMILHETPDPIIISIVFSASVLATGMRLRTKTMWDAFLVFFFLYIITSQAPYLLHLFRQLG